MTKDAYNELNADDVAKQIKEGTISLEDARAFEPAKGDRKTVLAAIEAREKEVAEAETEAAASPAVAGELTPNDPPAKLRKEAQENYSGNKIKVKTKATLDPRMTFHHPVTFVTIGREPALAPDDAWTRKHIGEGHFEVVSG